MPATDKNRFVFQFWIIALGNRGVEGIAIDMGDI